MDNLPKQRLKDDQRTLSCDIVKRHIKKHGHAIKYDTLTTRHQVFPKLV